MVLHVSNGPDAGSTFQVRTLPVLIRRDNAVTLTDPSVSRAQARLVYDAARDRVVVVNESVTNPTRVDGSEVVDQHVLSGGTATIEMGQTSMTLESTVGLP